MTSRARERRARRFRRHQLFGEAAPACDSRRPPATPTTSLNHGHCELEAPATSHNQFARNSHIISPVRAGELATAEGAH